MRSWKAAYLVELKQRRECDVIIDIVKLPEKKNGHPYLLLNKLEMEVRAYLRALSSNGAVVNTAIAIACLEGIVKHTDSNLLACNGGHITLTKHWGKHLLHRMGFVKRKASTKSKITIQNFKDIKAQFLFDIKVAVEMDEIPHDLIINWDQTGIHYVPLQSWTMEKEESNRVEIVAIDDKQQITAVFAASLTRNFVPPN